jgi:hypothetical protein
MTDLHRKIVIACARFFKRKYPNRCLIYLEARTKKDTYGKYICVDLLVINRRDNIHVVEVETRPFTIRSWSDGIEEICDTPGHKRWIAFPKEIFENHLITSERTVEECKERGIGILLSRKAGKGLAIDCFLEAKRTKNPQVYGRPPPDLLGKYPKVKELYEKGEDHSYKLR